MDTLASRVIVESSLVIGQPLPNLPWENRPAACGDVIWRYSANPIIPRDAIPTSNSIFNSAVVPFKDGFVAPDLRKQRRPRDNQHWECYG